MSTCFCFGKGSAFRKSEITLFDIMKNYFFVEQNVKKDPTEVRKIVVKNIKDHFLKENSETDIVITDKSINDKIKNIYLKRENLKKKQKNKQVSSQSISVGV